MQRLRIPQGGVWELLLIENNCTDETHAVVSKHTAALPIRYLHQPVQGLAHARNLALREARADWLIFTDDDVLADEHWLESYYDAISGCEPDVAFLGGTVLPWFEVEPDEELVEAIPAVKFGFCGTRIPERHVIETAADPLPFGASFAVRRSLLDGEQFNCKLGVSGSDLMGGEELEFLKRLVDRGLKGQWVPHAQVRHFVPRERLELPYLKRYLRGVGRTKVVRDSLRCGTRPQLQPWILRSIVESCIGMMFNKAFGTRKRFLQNFHTYNRCAGMLDALLRAKWLELTKGVTTSIE
jgi:glycosyltransferase involved in cell wall biosynthesis